MALATTCPACKTSFKVNPDQLKLRKGLVRCGKCEHVFSGVDFLRYVRDTREAQGNQEPDKQSTNSKPQIDEADALSPDTETVSEDLNTAFFLPETQMETSAAVQSEVTTAVTSTKEPTAEQSTTQAETAAETEAGTAPTRKQSRSKSSRRNSRRRKRRRATDRDPNAPTPDIAAIEDRREAGRRRADGSTTANTKPEPPQVSGNAQLASTQPLPGSEKEKQDMFDRQFGEAIDADRAVSDNASATGNTNEASNTGSDTEEFPDTLQANLPQAWQTTAIWPTYEEDMLAGELPADLPSEVGERGYRNEAKPRQSKTNQSEEIVAQPAKSEADADQANDATTDTEVERKGETDEQRAQQPAVHADIPAQNPFESALQTQASATDQDLHEADEEDAIDFFGQTSKPVFDFDLPPRGVWLTAAALSLLLCLQLAVGARDTLAAMFPPAKPLLQTIAAPLGLTVELPIDPESITIESFDLISTSNSDYVMNMLMRNRASTSLRWPAIELTLTDSTGGILVRKALMPTDYLKEEAMIAKGIDANVEHIVKLQFNTDGINPSGYSAVLFYY